MRYYLYIADAKVDMLLPQVPGAQRTKIASKLGFDVKLLSGSIETERATLADRVARLRAVEAHILETEPVGTPAAPQRWIAGEVEARATNIGEGAILFVAGTREWQLALGGSAHHLIGAVRRDDVDVGYSFLPAIIDMLKQMDEREHQFVITERIDEAMPGYWTAGLGSGEKAWTDLIREAFHQSIESPQRVAFLARRLLTTTDAFGPRVTLATPLYVALAD